MRWWPRPALVLALLAAVGCGARYARVPLREAPDLAVALRSEVRGGEPVARGFSHPATISALRAAHILSRLELRESKGGESGERRPAIPRQLVYELSGVLAEAFARADATQEVVVRAKRRERRLGVFSRTFATSFVAFVDAEGRLQIHLVDSDREIPAGDDGALAEPIAGRSSQPFKVLPGDHIAAIGQRALAIDWRADLFREPVAASESGRKRTILMESPAAEGGAAPGAESPLPSDSDERRALAELEEARRAGHISEAEYQRRRLQLLAPAPE